MAVHRTWVFETRATEEAFRRLLADTLRGRGFDVAPGRVHDLAVRGDGARAWLSLAVEARGVAVEAKAKGWRPRRLLAAALECGQEAQLLLGATNAPACPACNRPIPRVHGVDAQRCATCRRLLRDGPAPPTTPVLLRGAAGELRALRWWALFVPAAAVAELAVLAAAFASPGAGRLLGDCVTGPTPAPTDLAALLLASFVGLVAYVAGWAALAAERSGVARDAAWWRRVLPGSLLLAGIWSIGTLLVVPLLVTFVWFLFAPVALGLGARPFDALEASRAAGRRRPPGFAAVLVGLALAVQLVLLLAGCGPGFFPGLALQGLAWWLLAPLVPVLTAHAWDHLAPRPREG